MAEKRATESKEAATTTDKGGHKRILTGVVVSDKMQKTIVVKVDRRVKHGMYPKYQLLSKKYKAHDEKREAKVGDRVEIVECRPLSKEKTFALRRILERSTLQQERG